VPFRVACPAMCQVWGERIELRSWLRRHDIEPVLEGVEIRYDIAKFGSVPQR
jgi:hypothetical protein